MQVASWNQRNKAENELRRSERQRCPGCSREQCWDLGSAHGSAASPGQPRTLGAGNPIPGSPGKHQPCRAVGQGLNRAGGAPGHPDPSAAPGALLSPAPKPFLLGPGAQHPNSKNRHSNTFPALLSYSRGHSSDTRYSPSSLHPMEFVCHTPCQSQPSPFSLQGPPGFGTTLPHPGCCPAMFAHQAGILQQHIGIFHSALQATATSTFPLKTEPCLPTALYQDFLNSPSFFPSVKKIIALQF